MRESKSLQYPTATLGSAHAKDIRGELGKNRVVALRGVIKWCGETMLPPPRAGNVPMAVLSHTYDEDKGRQSPRPEYSGDSNTAEVTLTHEDEKEKLGPRPRQHKEKENAEIQLTKYKEYVEVHLNGLQHQHPVGSEGGTSDVAKKTQGVSKAGVTAGMLLIAALCILAFTNMDAEEEDVSARQYFVLRNHRDGDLKPEGFSRTMLGSFLIASFAAMIAEALTFPFDALKTRMQLIQTRLIEDDDAPFVRLSVSVKVDLDL